MCKNLMLAGIRPDKQDELYKFLFEMAPLMTRNDQDGLGLAAMTEFGIWGERWLKREEAFQLRVDWSEQHKEVPDMYMGLQGGHPTYNYFVENDKVVDAPTMALIMHARAATCEVALKNVHPFLRGNTAMIHNGVINNDHQLKKIYSTCDSEVILNSYVDHKVSEIPDNIKEVGGDLAGSYACGILTRNKEGVPILDIFRGSPSLWVMYVKTLEAFVLCTSAEMVEQACRNLKWNIGSVHRVKDDKLLRVDARTGRFLSFHPFYSSYVARNNHYGTSNYNPYGPWSSHRSGNQSGTDTDSTKELPVIGPKTSCFAAVVGENDPNNSDDDSGIPTQAEIELARTEASAEKKTVSSVRKHPKVLELEKVKRLTAPSNSTTGKDIAATAEDKTKVVH